MSKVIKPSCGWLLTRNPGANGVGDAIIIGPNLRKARLNLQEELVSHWLEDAPHECTLWTEIGKNRLPKLLVVLEEWTCPTWTRISWEKKANDPGRSAVGLLTTDETIAPGWRFLAMSDATMTSFRIGNTSVRSALITP